MCSAMAGRNEEQEMAREGRRSCSGGCELAKGFMPCAQSIACKSLKYSVWCVCVVTLVRLVPKTRAFLKFVCSS